MKSIYNYISEALIKKDTKIKQHNWTIENAQDGDIITEIRKIDNTKSMYIFKEIKYIDTLQEDMIVGHCYYDFDMEKFLIEDDCVGWVVLRGYKNNRFNYWLSTTKEKREFLNIIKSEGYNWDPNKKELVKL